MIQWFFISGYVLQNMLQVGFGKTFQNLPYFDQSVAYVKNGSLELSKSRWASRPHIVMKTPAHTHKDLIDVGKCKLRVCGDYRLVNQQIVKIVPNLPTGLEEVERAAGGL